MQCGGRGYTGENFIAGCRYLAGMAIHIRQSLAVIEDGISYSGDGTGYIDACQAIAVMVFANRFISEIYILNGRKVKT